MKRVAQLVDSLDPGGTERVAVQIANGLAERGFESYLLTGRHDGALASEVLPSVHRLCLERRRRLSPTSVVRLARYLDRHEIDVLHAHSTSLFLAAAAALLRPKTRIVWHVHYGRAASALRSRRVYALAARRTDAVLSVNRDLQRWAVDELGLPVGSVHYLANWVSPRRRQGAESTELDGPQGARIVCVANIRPEKGHEYLVRAFAEVCRTHRDATLFLIGAGSDSELGRGLAAEVERLGLQERVHFLGLRHDVPELLRQGDVGVLSSVSEGLPLALLEYGLAGLPVVVTAVGDCTAVVDHEVSGLQVEARDETALAEALTRLLDDPEWAHSLGNRLRDKVERSYSADAGFERLASLYSALGGMAA